MKTTLEYTKTAPSTPQVRKNAGGANLERSIAIDRSVAEVYSFCRDLENFPSFVRHLESVTVLDVRTSYWAVRSSENYLWAWGVEITEDRMNDLISWRSFDDADIRARGSLQFSAGAENRGTVVKLTMQYSPSGEKFLAAAGKVLENDVQTMIDGDLFRLKTLLESGKVPVATGQSSTRGKENSARISPNELKLGRE